MDRVEKLQQLLQHAKEKWEQVQEELEHIGNSEMDTHQEQISRKLEKLTQRLISHQSELKDQTKWNSVETSPPMERKFTYSFLDSYNLEVQDIFEKVEQNLFHISKLYEESRDQKYEELMIKLADFRESINLFYNEVFHSPTIDFMPQEENLEFDNRGERILTDNS